MGKFRSKLKRRTKGKHWAHGQSATSNPENKKHRLKARSRFFQPNLSLAPTPAADGSAGLTLEALSKHDARLSYTADGKQKADPTVNDIAMSLRSFSFSEEEANESQFGTFKTFQTFASNYSACSNMTFNKFLQGFRQTSDLHKEMLAILTAITEVIKERNGTQSSTEFFLALMETLEAAKQENEIIPCLSLLSMGIKSVPQAVLRKKFADCGPVFLNLLESFADTENQNVLRSLIGCISVLLRAQDYSDWSAPLTLKLFNHILTFVIHTKPKVRKAAQHAIASIIHGSCFMAPPKPATNAEGEPIATTSDNNNTVPYHPAGTYVAKFCAEQFKPENITKSQTVVLHALTLLRDVINGFKGDDVKDICENILSVMTASKVMIQTNCFHTLHALFASKSQNLTPSLIAKLIAAIYDYRPEQSDVRQTLAWLTVIKQGHICLALFDLTMCINALPRFVDVCAGDVWMSSDNQIASSAANSIKEILMECVKPACETEQLATAHRKPVTRIINTIARGLNAPFGHVAKQVVLVFSIVFEVAGEYFSDVLQEPLKVIAARYDDNDSSRLQIEHAILSAIPTMGPEAVLTAIPLTDDKSEVSVSRSWLLPLLREGIKHSTFEFFYRYVYKLAEKCHDSWHRYAAEDNLPLAHTNELLYCQLWGLFPGFCRNPRDMSKFGAIAKILGMSLQSKPEIRAPILDGLKELLKNADDESKQELKRFAENFLRRLFNIYSAKPSGTFENDIRISSMEVIKEYLKIAPDDTLVKLFEAAKEKYKTMERVETILQKIQTLNDSLLVRNESDGSVAKDGVEQERIKQAYECLQSLLNGENALGIEYVDENTHEVQEYLKIVPAKRLQHLFKATKTHLGAFVYESYFDIVESLAVYQSAEQLKELFESYITPTLKNAKKGGVSRIIRERQLKAYELLKDILSSENDGCKQFVKENMKEIQKVLLGSLQQRRNTSEVPRLTCVLILLENEWEGLQINSKLVSKTIPEVVLSFKSAINKKKENIALQLLLKIGELYQNAGKLNDLIDILMAGFGGDSVLITNTILVLKAIVQHFTGGLTLSTVTYILEQILAFVVSRSRPEVEASMLFLLIFIKILPAPFVANHLADIVKAVSAMAPDTKRHCRLHIGHILTRLCKRYTAEEVIKLVPGNDEVTHKRLKNIRKELARKKRQNLANEKAGASDDEDDDDSQLVPDLKKKTYTIDDVLADSDSDLENDIMLDAEEKGEQRTRKTGAKDQKYIHEDAESIVDLMDINAMSKISSSKPIKTDSAGKTASKKTKDPNRGFKVAEDGRLVIEEPKRGASRGNDSDSDDESGDDLPGAKSKKIFDDLDSDDDDDIDDSDAKKLTGHQRKRKASGSLSAVSGKTGSTHKYVAGGKGIHRPLGAQSVRSGVSRMSTATAATSAYGSEYRGKKAKGDIKKKGKVDPYAYIPLSRNSLNKRKRAKNSGQFKNIVAGARKGAAAGSKNKKRKLK